MFFSTFFISRLGGSPFGCGPGHSVSPIKSMPSGPVMVKFLSLAPDALFIIKRLDLPAILGIALFVTGVWSPSDVFRDPQYLR